jgi:cell wall-associated NlpC family hydrolase
VLSRVPTGTYLALTTTSGNWYGVLMQDRTVGWLRKSAVDLLDFAVVSNQPIGPLQSAGEPPVLAGGHQAILQTAYYYLGVPYKWGGTSDNGMDCSAFVRKCFQAVGISLPRTSREQINVGMNVDPSQLQACDRLYFANKSGTITHTGIYIGDGYFIHSSSSRGGVAVSRLNEPMYRKMFAGARR